MNYCDQNSKKNKKRNKKRHIDKYSRIIGFLIITIITIILREHLGWSNEIPSYLVIIPPFQLEAPKIIETKNADVYREDIPFKWKYNYTNVIFDIDISNSKKFLNPIHYETYSKNIIIYKHNLIKLGKTIYWRVRARYENHTSAYDFANFTISWCGDGLCNHIENCENCPIDCGYCIRKNEEKKENYTSSGNVIYIPSHKLKENITKRIINETKLKKNDIVVIKVGNTTLNYIVEHVSKYKIVLRDEFGKIHELKLINLSEKYSKLEEEKIEIKEIKICKNYGLVLLIIIAIIIALTIRHRIQLKKLFLPGFALELLLFYQIYILFPGCNRLQNYINIIVPSLIIATGIFLEEKENENNQ